MKPRIQIVDSRLNWTPPDGVNRARPRPVRLTGGGKALLFLALALIAGGVAAAVGLGVLASRQTEERLLREEGAVTDGFVTRLWRRKGESRQPWVAYRFTAGGRAYEQDAKVSLRVWNKLRVGSPFAVRYVPSKPELNHPLGATRRTMPLWIPYVVAVVMVTCGSLATLPIRRQSRLLAEGRPAPGHVTRHSNVVRGTHGADHGREFHYEFPLLSGAIAKGKGGPRKQPPAIGSTIPVLYDPDNPRRNAPYPLPLVRLSHLRIPIN